MEQGLRIFAVHATRSTRLRLSWYVYTRWDGPDSCCHMGWRRTSSRRPTEDSKRMGILALIGLFLHVSEDSPAIRDCRRQLADEIARNVDAFGPRAVHSNVRYEIAAFVGNGNVHRLSDFSRLFAQQQSRDVRLVKTLPPSQCAVSESWRRVRGVVLTSRPEAMRCAIVPSTSCSTVGERGLVK
jgi:hypothetical protein